MLRCSITPVQDGRRAKEKAPEGALQVCGDTCSDPVAAKLRSTPGKLQFLTGVEVGWAPVYGKLSLMGSGRCTSIRTSPPVPSWCGS